MSTRSSCQVGSDPDCIRPQPSDISGVDIQCCLFDRKICRDRQTTSMRAVYDVTASCWMLRVPPAESYRRNNCSRLHHSDCHHHEHHHHQRNTAATSQSREGMGGCLFTLKRLRLGPVKLDDAHINARMIISMIEYFQGSREPSFRDCGQLRKLEWTPNRSNWLLG